MRSRCKATTNPTALKRSTKRVVQKKDARLHHLPMRPSEIVDRRAALLEARGMALEPAEDGLRAEQADLAGAWAAFRECAAEAAWEAEPDGVAVTGDTVDAGFMHRDSGPPLQHD